MVACIPEAIDEGWVIDSVAFIPQSRRKGLAEKLLLSIMEKGRSRDHSRAQVNVYIGNEPALQLYRKLGFAVIGEKRDRYFEEATGSPGMLNLARDL